MEIGGSKQETPEGREFQMEKKITQKVIILGNMGKIDELKGFSQGFSQEKDVQWECDGI